MGVWILYPTPSCRHSLKTGNSTKKEGGQWCRASAGRGGALWSSSTAQCSMLIHFTVRHWPSFNLFSQDNFSLSQLHGAPPPVNLWFPWTWISRTMQDTVHRILAEMWGTNACWYLLNIFSLVDIWCFTVVPHLFDKDWHDTIGLCLVVMYLACDSLEYETFFRFLTFSWSEIWPDYRDLVSFFLYCKWVCTLKSSSISTTPAFQFTHFLLHDQVYLNIA